jgi:thymidylate kinase
MLKRPVYIDLEGADLTGKSTLLKMTFKASDYSKILCFHDRGILTHCVYNELYNRFTEDKALWYEQLILFCRDNAIVLLVADDNNILRNRYNNLRQDDIYKREEIVKVNIHYQKVYTKILRYYENVRQIIIDNKTPYEIFEEASEHYELMLRKAKT